MNRLPFLFILLCPAFAFAAENEPTTAVTLVAGENDSQWRPLFEALAAQEPIFSTFTEKRWFPFRKSAIELTGELRFSRERGLSLRYLTPKERMMIADDTGVLLRDSRGRSKVVPPDPRSGNPDTALLAILRFDLDELLEMYEIQAAGDSGGWEFVFTPKDAEVRKSIGQITASGSEAALTGFEFRRSESQRVEIAIGETATQVTFTPEEIEKFFR
jgi:outer membrane lipoprotein-sorting protein